jgi:hypothetical protein
MVSGIKVSRESLLGSTAIIFYLAIVKLIIPLLTNSQYGFSRDELYYIACGNHLAFGYVDHPPLAPLLAKIIGILLGNSLLALRVLPAIAGAAIVFLTGLMVRKLRGGIFAQAAACLCVIIAPNFLNMDILFTTNVFDQLLWFICLYLLITLLKNNSDRYWPQIGLVIGIGLLNKYTVVFLIIGLLCGMLFCPARRHFLYKKFWLGILIAILLVLPNLIWQFNHDWPTIEFLRKATINRMAEVSPIKFAWEQIISNNPITFPFWIAGLWFFLFSKKGQSYRVIGYVYVIIFLIFALQKSKGYYLAPMYPALWTAGSIVLEKMVNHSKQTWLKFPIIALLVLGGIIIAPIGLPILPAAKAVQYSKYFSSGLNLGFSDMLGWEHMVAKVDSIYDELPAQDKAKCAILANNYGQAAAIDYYGGKYGLPKALSTHNNYWLWGPREYTGEIIISVGVKLSSLQQGFGKVDLAGTVYNDYVVWYETNQPIYIWREPKIPLKQMWPKIKLYY